MRQRPRLASQVSTERIFTVSMPDSSMRLRHLFVDHRAGFDQHARTTRLIALDADRTHPRPATLPTMRSANGSITSSPSFSAAVSRPRIVPQSSSAIVTSCATSHETTREVPGVGRLERRVGQTLTGAVRRR